MIGLTNYMFRMTSEEAFSLCRPRAVFAEKAHLLLQKEIQELLGEGGDLLPRQGFCGLRHPSFFIPEQRCLAGTSSWTRWMDHPALSGCQDSVVSPCDQLLTVFSIIEL